MAEGKDKSQEPVYADSKVYLRRGFFGHGIKRRSLRMTVQCKQFPPSDSIV
jgi:hypothetical protein